MNFYSKISINFDCEVVEGGYLLQTSLINPAKCKTKSNFSSLINFSTLVSSAISVITNFAFFGTKFFKKII